jgi:hypothetical protein
VFKPTGRMNYAIIHLQVKKLHGPASDWRCAARCGRQAYQWAYCNDAEEELTDPKTGCPYSADTDDYVPLCRICHTQFDYDSGRRLRNVKAMNEAWRSITHCPKGHEYTEENTRITPEGQRKCRACHRDWERERQLQDVDRSRKRAKRLARQLEQMTPEELQARKDLIAKQRHERYKRQQQQ